MIPDFHPDDDTEEMLPGEDRPSRESYAHHERRWQPQEIELMLGQEFPEERMPHQSG